MKRFFHTALLAFCVAFVFLSSSLQAAGPTIHVVIAADGRAGFGANLIADLKNMERIFNENVPKSQLDLVSMEMGNVTPDGILETVAKIKVEANDTLVFYYSGHGAYDVLNNGQYFQLSDKKGNSSNLQRRTLLAAMKEKNARLIVLLSDCCNAESKPTGESKDFRQSAQTKSPERISPLFDALFIRPSGLVNLTSSKRGEVSLLDTSSKKRGSCFTWPFAALVDKLRDSSDIDWPEFVKQLRADVQKAFLESWPDGIKFDPPMFGISLQKAQTVEVYDLPGKEAVAVNQGPRFGVRALTHPGGGVRVTEVVPNGPGHRAGFEVGDVIVEINGEAVNNENDYGRLVDQSPKKMNAKVINVNDNRTLNVSFELAN